MTSKQFERLLGKFVHRRTPWQKIKGSIVLLAQFAIVFAFFFSVLNIPAYLTKVRYFYNINILKKPIQSEELAQVDQIARALQSLPTVESTPTPITPQLEDNKPKSTIQSAHPKKLANNHLFIPKINVKAPIIWQVAPESFVDQLRRGVIHYQGTALPGEGGNTVISGHSSNFWWDPGNFKQVFALLGKLGNGDRVILTQDNSTYVYEVEHTFIVNPDQTEVLNPIDHPIVTLLTCTPVGTTINRLIVQAKQIYPEATSTNIPIQSPSLPNTLPAVR